MSKCGKKIKLNKNNLNHSAKIKIMTAHEIDYQIFGEEMQYVEIELDPQEIVIADQEAL
jgi:hypothetical protein